ncbi:MULTISPECIES: hypothetical protein [unclassified Mesorhizobium]|uniref:hypothetical protein n=1 Tax=unclassified Mesorhizobium TaxID=325217 RepID=UPI000BAF8E66|nr:MULTISPECIES: hypothetical protein [unclassified Mesorhizobium]TGT60357.1 hypothetical protein EN813_021900 [Mesorhizobium sp. M00.F.Ca.ET.170.01.1.1]AZO10537.1 hypothetical protein EJ074_16410 [Mesorhizobium sp. M3A.F.Ca.ET.080.04.2.1]PBB88069.1 hypothetical protein CK216_06010 [Mesorhizobium sp. WSM3876]RWB69195.1 MAG: hypothetical protein EOQ49_21435 [Mesorhizobium sp.]RWB84156.1 MAG: hypothetical protein EOQ52_24725 [Mesorhizobium sp.]
MKHERLCAIAHNFADSMASGLGFVVGYCQTDVFGEAAISTGGVIEIDFLRGSVVRGRPSDQLKSAAVIFGQAFPAFCKRNGAEVTDFQSFLAAFDARGGRCRAVLTVVDRNGRSSLTEYDGVPLKRLRVLDTLGRIRRKTRQIEKVGQ